MQNNPQRLKWNFKGLSTDTKPMPEDSYKVTNGSTYFCVDTSEFYIFLDGQWWLQKKGGGGVSDYTQLSNLPSINGVELIGNKTSEELHINKPETQIIGWTRITPDTDSELDIRDLIEQGYHRFTILVYIRKGGVRQGVKYELTDSELQKIGSKTTTNMVCITRSCLNPNGSNATATVKQCVTAVQDGGGTPIFGLMNIKYQLYDASGTVISSGLDNFEWCMYAE